MDDNAIERQMQGPPGEIERHAEQWGASTKAVGSNNGSAASGSFASTVVPRHGSLKSAGNSKTKARETHRGQ